MDILDKKMIVIAIKNLKDSFRRWEYYLFSLGFPIMFTFLFYFILGSQGISNGLSSFDYGFPGMIIYATSVGTVSAAIGFASDKSSGMLERLDTMPTGRKNVFLGSLISESITLTLQIIIMFVLGYVILGVYFNNLLGLLIGFLVSLLFGISAVGMGIIIASVSKTPQIANGFSLMYYLPILFISGSLMPFESPIVYFTPPYWAKQVYMQITVMGHGLEEQLYSSSLIGYTAEAIPIPIWGGVLIIFGFTLIFIILGIIIFQKKTKF